MPTVARLISRTIALQLHLDEVRFRAASDRWSVSTTEPIAMNCMMACSHRRSLGCKSYA